MFRDNTLVFLVERTSSDLVGLEERTIKTDSVGDGEEALALLATV